MKIEKINAIINSQPQKPLKTKTTNPYKEELKQENLSYSYSNIYFTARKYNKKASKKTFGEYQDYKRLRNVFTPETKEIINLAKEVAKKANSPEVESWHVFYANLIKLREYIEELDKGLIRHDENSRYQIPNQIERMLSDRDESFFDKEKSRAKIKQVVENHIKKMNETFVKTAKVQNPIKRNYPFGIGISNDLIDEFVEIYQYGVEESKTDLFLDTFLYTGAFTAQNKKLAKEALDFDLDIRKALTIQEIGKRKRHLSFYDNKADLLWKNINSGNNTIITCDMQNYSQLKYLKSSFVNLIKKPDNKYKNINPDKTEVLVLNEFVTPTTLEVIIKEQEQKKDTKTVIISDLRTLVTNANGTLSLSFIPLLKNDENGNVKLIFTIDPETYYAYTAKGVALSEALGTYSVLTLPTLNIQDAYKYLTDENGLKFIEDETKKSFNIETIKEAIKLTNNKEGNYPDKAINLLKSVAKYHDDIENITPEILQNFVEETKKLSEITAKNEEGDVIFNTGVKLKDIVGTPMTKADAKSIVDQIEKGTFKTKGYTIYHSDGSAYGGGRKHTALSIAGEAGIPVITVNAKDFALKDIDTVSQNANFMEMKIRKIFSSAKAQAEANPNNTAMIFIENFDNFGSNPLYGISSIYEQKAFSQLLDEMKNARQNNKSNLLIIGSVNMPELIDPNIMKPYRFLNSIIVYPPHTNEERKEVLDYYIKKMNLKIKGDNQEEKEDIVKRIAQTTAGFSVVDIVYLLETAKNVMQERNKEEIDLSDLTEAFLQETTGRPAPKDNDENNKKIIASHEAGHAIVLQIMNEISKKYGQSWQIPNEIDFITLDPRGDYGGAMYHKASENKQMTFETVMALLACSYGGHSAENIIYSMNGSWGITGDIESIDSLAKLAVLDMGMGPKTGARRVERDAQGNILASETKKEMIEKDIDSFINGAKEISDKIIEAYKPFIEEFTEKYFSKVGSGDCIISSDEFIKELNKYRANINEAQRRKMEKLEKEIIQIIKDTKEDKTNPYHL